MNHTCKISSFPLSVSLWFHPNSDEVCLHRYVLYFNPSLKMLLKFVVLCLSLDYIYSFLQSWMDQTRNAGISFLKWSLMFWTRFFQICLQILNLKWITVFFIAHDLHYKPCLHGIHHKITFSYLLTFNELTKSVHLSLFMSTFTTYGIS